MTEPAAPPTDPAGARAYDDAIEEARRDEQVAELRTDARDALTRLDAGGRDAVRALIRVARWIDAATRHDPEFDEIEDSLDLIDEATAHADSPPRSRVDGEIVLGTDFRGLTASVGALGEAIEVHAPGSHAQAWLRFPTPSGADVIVALGSMRITDDAVHLVAAGVPSGWPT